MLIDGHSIAYRAFFALPVENFSTQTGQHTNGVFGFTSMLINVVRDEKPTHLGVAFDVSRHTFRSEIYSEYKANRTTTPDEFRGQLDLVKEVLGRPDSTLIVWHHGTMAKLVRNFPIVNSDAIPKHWPDERFDLIWVLVRQPGAEPKYRFVVVPQMLLADDEETV